MKLTLMIIGGVLVAFGLVDLLGSYGGFDLWTTIGIELPELLWRYSSYIELIAGGLLFKAGKAMETEIEDDSAQSA
ncbi:MAG: hypothetical protein MJK11_15965 [Pseudomonadales bacterium]|nr:hypothetical protein [Pseudomonadales bacterium]